MVFESYVYYSKLCERDIERLAVEIADGNSSYFQQTLEAYKQEFDHAKSTRDSVSLSVLAVRLSRTLKEIEEINKDPLKGEL